MMTSNFSLDAVITLPAAVVIIIKETDQNRTQTNLEQDQRFTQERIMDGNRRG